MSETFASAATEPLEGSLEARVAARRRELEDQRTERFTPPGFEGVFEVELQMLGWRKLRQIAARHERVRDQAQREARTAADTILAATVGFHRIVDDEGNTQPADGATWMQLARAFDKTLDATANPRVALFRLLKETQVVFLWNEWMEWMRSGTPKLDEELARDFRTIPSSD